MIHAVQRTYTDGLNGQTVFTYHARLDGLSADSVYRYGVTADNDRRGRLPFSSSFRTAPRGRVAFRWTSYGDLATPDTLVDAVLAAKPPRRRCGRALPAAVPSAQWRSLLRQSQSAGAAGGVGGLRQQRAALRGQSTLDALSGQSRDRILQWRAGTDAYLTRYSLPDNGTQFPGRWYRFRVGSVLFISLAADDVIYQDSGAFVAGPEPLMPAPSTGNAPIQPGTSLYVSGYSRGAQTRWLEATLAAAAQDPDIDWIVVQMHQDALSSSRDGNGCDKGIRETWLPLFDRYGVDLVLCGHDHDYERSWPVRGCNQHVGRDAVTGSPVDTCQPQPSHHGRARRGQASIPAAAPFT